MKKVIGAILVEDIRFLIKGKARKSKIYLVSDGDELFIETTTPLPEKQALEIISRIIKKQ